MSTYLELKQRAEALMAQAEQLRAEEKAAAIEEIRQKMATYGLTAADLGLVASRTTSRQPAVSRKSPPAKFEGPHGELWTGRGRQPKWMVSALAAGANLDQFRI